MPEEKDLNSIGSLFAAHMLKPKVKPPAYQWQDLALRVIAELGVPPEKKNSVFQVCRRHPQTVIEIALNDTKELVQKGEPWKYFFKVLANRGKPMARS